MEVVWFGVGFLVGISLWMPFMVSSRIDAMLEGLEGRIGSQLLRIAGWEGRSRIT